MPSEQGQPESKASRDLQSEVAELSRTDAGHAILAFALIDNELERLLLQYMGLSDTLAEKLFSGALRSFITKARLARKLNLVDKDTFKDMDVIRDIRNAYAHPRGAWDFASAEIIRLVKRFAAWTEGADARALFYDRASAAIAAMEAERDRLTYKHVTEFTT